MSYSDIVRMPRPETDFTMFHNDVIRNPDLSWEAAGVLLYLLSKPDNWTVSHNHLVNYRDAGHAKIRRILRELEDAGYLVRERVRNEKGVFVAGRSVLYDSPRGRSQPRDGNRTEDNRAEDNRTQRSTDSKEGLNSNKN